MCGISGVYQTQGEITRQTLAQMTDCMAHRGPDFADTIIYEAGGRESVESGAIGLGHRRLAIIDLSPLGRQPMHYKAHSIVFNGEIYNYQSVKDELIALGYGFESESDTEVLLAAYDCWQMDMLGKLNGMFTFILWDADRQQMWAARDRLGIKPLYYYCKDGLFIAGSELKTILQHPRVAPEMNLNSLGEYFNRGYISSPRTIFNDIHKLEPGHYLRVENATISEHAAYWQVSDYFEAQATVDEATAREQVNELLRDAVRLRMISDVPLGALLSGGIDSSLVVAMMQEQASNPIKTFTVAFTDAQYQEAHHARAVADHLGTDHTELFISEEELVDFVPQLVTYFDEPFADNSAIPTRAVYQAAREHVTVVLTGDGGDELFLGYPTYHWIAMRERVRRYTPPMVASSLFALGSRMPQRRVSRFATLAGFDTAVEAHRWVTAHWPLEQCQELITQWQPPLATAYDRVVDRLEGQHILKRLSAGDISNYMVDDILTKADRASMSVSLEARVPILDHRVVEYVSGLPVEMKYHQGASKRLLRDLAYQYVPRAILDRPKKGFGAPIDQWLRGPLYDLMRTHLAPDAIKQHGLLDADVVQRVVTEYIDDYRPHSQKIWNLLVFQLWYGRYMN